MRPINAILNGISLCDLDGRILVHNISEEPPQSTLTYGENPGRCGQRLLERHRENRRFTITFAIKELFDLAARARLVDQVNAWAQDGTLQVSYRPGRQIGVVVAARACVQSPRNYNEEFQIRLEAAAVPFWEDTVPERLLLAGAGGSANLRNSGTVPAEPNITVTPTGGALGSLTLTLGSRTFAFTGLDVTQGTPLRVYYDDRGILRAAAGGSSKLSCRSAASADDLIAQPGVNVFSFVADTACSVVAEVRGRWL